MTSLLLRSRTRRHTTLPAANHRPDIDGLRAVAVLLVIGYHVWIGRVSGGVDVFLMISAFFLTGTFVRRVSAGHPLQVGRYWLRTFARLLPAAALTIVGVLVTIWVVYPATRWPSIWEQSWASLLYAQNWVLAADSVDYYARQETPSPLQHFWSLSVQGQVFLLWPLVFLLSAVLVRRLRVSATACLAVLFGTIFAASLVYSIVYTAEDQTLAYFDTGARLWEFAAGSLLAVLLPLVSLPRSIAAVVSWLGLAGILLCGLVLDVQGGFPGYLALWPVLCTAAVVVGGRDGGPASTRRVLSTRVLRFVGRDAYALYLVHWPILITWLVVRERTEAGFFGGMFVIALTLVAARLVTWAVDAPGRRLREHPRMAGALVAGALVAVIVPLAAWQAATAVATARSEASAYRTNPGGALLLDPDRDDDETLDAPMLPVATEVHDDWTPLGTECTGRFAVSDPIPDDTCAQTMLAARSEHLVVVIGDSHARQLSGAFLPVAAERGWGVVSLLRGGCAMGLEEAGFEEGCPQWRDAAIDYVVSLQPDAVVTVVTRADAGEPDEVVRPGIEGFVARMHEAGIGVIGVRDNPRFDFDMYGCFLASEGVDPCTVPLRGSLAATNPARPLAASGVQLIDLAPYICPDEVCRPVVGNVAVYMDDNHLTDTYARSLATAFARQLSDGFVQRDRG